MFTEVFTPWQSVQQHLMKLLVKPFASSSTQVRQRKYSSLEELRLVSTGWHVFAEEILTEDDQVLISVMEHHSNINSMAGSLPKRLGQSLFMSNLKDGALDMDDLRF